MSINTPYVTSTQVASSVPFDNSTNGFSATDSQAAIEEARNVVINSTVSFTSAVSTTSSTFSMVDSLTLTPSMAGTYLVLWSGNVRTANGANGNGEVAIFSSGSQITDSTRSVNINVALLLGIIGTSTINNNAGSITTVTTVNGSQAIDVRFRSTSGDTVTADRGRLTVLKIG